jgi:hypothetical protein
MKSIMRKLAAKRSQKTGDMAERLCQIALEQAGYKLIEKVTTPRICVKGRFIYTKTCSGDFRAVGPGGRSVLVECKYRDRPLRPSDFQPHQLESLSKHYACGGTSLIAHCSKDGCTITEWSFAIDLIGLPF